MPKTCPLLSFPRALVTYTPPGGFVGADSFTYTLNDGFGGTAPGLVNVKVANLAY